MEIAIHEHVIRFQIIELTGRLEALNVAQLREAHERLLQAGEKYFVVDLRQVSFMDSAGLAALVSLLKQARQISGNVILVKPVNSSANRILTLTRFDQVFQMTATVEEAIALF